MRSPRRVSVSFWSACALAGMVASRWVVLPAAISSGLIAAAFGAILLGIKIRKSSRMIICFACSGLLIGLWAGGRTVLDHLQLQKLVGRNVTVSGLVATDPQIDAKEQYIVAINHLRVNGQSYRSQARLVFARDEGMKRGDSVTVRGTVSGGFGLFGLSLYRSDILNRTAGRSNVLLAIRDRFVVGVRRSIGGEAGGLGLGFVTGQKTDISTATENNLRVIGLSHIIVASGYNLTIIVEFLRRMTRRFSRYTTLMSGLFGIIGFLVITGISPSMVRAAVVAGLSLVAWYFGRRIHPIVVLLLGAAITALVHPEYVWGDVGWYLSFLSFFGVLVLAPLLKAYFFADKSDDSVLRSIVLETTSALIMTLPLTIYTFGIYSPLALIANCIVLPFVPVGMLSVIAGGFAGSTMPLSIARVIALPARFILGAILKCTAWFSALPYAAAELSIGRSGLAGCYIVIFCVCIYIYEKSVKNAPAALTV